MIQVLDEKTINQIAAGEVIERPMAVVKELVENAIDAGASAITIEIKEGGISFIRITDNGCGIKKNEIEKAFLPHATSKIKDASDLLAIKSLGFRGEALSSIAAVCQTEVISKTKDSITGIKYEIDGGEKKSLQEVGCPDGTTFIVRNIFFNTPARRKFLKSKVTEGNYINDLIIKYSLAHTQIRFNFISDGKTKLQTSGDGQLKSNIFYNYGMDVTKSIIAVYGETDTMTLTGFIGKPELSRGNKSYINYFVNGRYIKSPVITSAIENAYASYLMNHRFPFVTLDFRIDSSLIDVNVHPTKMEIRFSNQKEVYDLFYNTIYNVLQNISLAPNESIGEKEVIKLDEKKSLKKEPEPFEVNRLKTAASNDFIKFESGKKENNIIDLRKTDIKDAIIYKSNDNIDSDIKNEKLYIDNKPTQQTIAEKNYQYEVNKPEFRLIGQVFATYWMLEYENNLLIIDQHAAHEKVLYEKLIKRMEEKTGLSQNLISPIVVNLSARENMILNENIEAFKKIGFKLEAFGDKDFIITSIPADFLNINAKELFIEILDSLLDENGKIKAELVTDHIATMACKAAVKGNNELSFAEAKKLFEEMLMAKEPYHCPHGRPTTIIMNKNDFDKKFKRII